MHVEDHLIGRAALAHDADVDDPAGQDVASEDQSSSDWGVTEASRPGASQTGRHRVWGDRRQRIPPTAPGSGQTTLELAD
jgi:hypothetical protein